MRVILAGSTGAIGRPLLKALRDNGHETTAIVRNAANRGLVEDLGAVAVVVDVMDGDALFAWLLRLVGPYLEALMAQTSMRIDTVKARTELGWKPRYASIGEGLAQR